MTKVAAVLFISTRLLHAIRTYTIPRLFHTTNAGLGLGMGLAMLELQHADHPLLAYKVSETPNIKWNDGQSYSSLSCYSLKLIFHMSNPNLPTTVRSGWPRIGKVCIKGGCYFTIKIPSGTPINLYYLLLTAEAEAN